MNEINALEVPLVTKALFQSFFVHTWQPKLHESDSTLQRAHFPLFLLIKLFINLNL